jgi:hypothetical protein
MKKLTGTQKQIEWAEKIRSQMLPNLTEIIVNTEKEMLIDTEKKEMFISGFGNPFDFGGSVHRKYIDILIVLVNKLINCTEAKSWIENRNITTNMLIGISRTAYKNSTNDIEDKKNSRSLKSCAFEWAYKSSLKCS